MGKVADGIRGRLTAVAENLAWSWSAKGPQLFARIDPEGWRAARQSPKRLLKMVPDARLEGPGGLAGDAGWMADLAAVEAVTPSVKLRKRYDAAYYCMEYGLHESVPLYSGGLGVLAGDHLKACSDLGVSIVGVGMLWREGYYRQRVDSKGEASFSYPVSDVDEMPIVETGARVEVAIGKRRVTLAVWMMRVGAVPLLLLDADVPENRPADRALTARLYSGDSTMRIAQEVCLGIGGARALAALGITSRVDHLNEGHAAFCALERMRGLVHKGRSFATAVRSVRKRTVFTTHTPVPAGHDRFEAALVKRTLPGLDGELGVSWREVLGLGRVDPNDQRETFCMTVLALKTAARVNGVAKLHGEVSREMWRDVRTLDGGAVEIRHITNGVHTPSWTSRMMLGAVKDGAWSPSSVSENAHNAIASMSDEKIWELRCAMRGAACADLERILHDQAVSRGDSAGVLAQIRGGLDPDALTIGFARRFATYKRAALILRDPERLGALLGNAKKPVQIVFSGKAHPRDAEGNAVLREVFRATRSGALAGRVWFVEEYDMAVGRLLTSGCDVWLNNPVRPQEASGTSGMKVPLNMGLNCSILDGWWPEAYDGTLEPGVGWAIPSSDAEDPKARDAAEAEALLRTLERGVVPKFYKREGGVPRRWVEMIRRSSVAIPAAFSARRMVGEYADWAYRS